MKEFQVDHNTRSFWLARAKSYNQLDHRSYATVVHNGKAVVQTSQLPASKKHVFSRHKVSSLDTAKKVTKVNFSPQHTCETVQKQICPSKLHPQEFSIPLTNRFEALQEAMLSDEHEVTTSSHIATAKHFTSRGNKNGNGQTLGIAGQQQQQTNVVDLSFDSCFKGNKNKNGHKLGQSTDEKVQSYSHITVSNTETSHCRMHADFTFLGNKKRNWVQIGKHAGSNL